MLTAATTVSVSVCEGQSNGILCLTSHWATTESWGVSYIYHSEYDQHRGNQFTAESAGPVEKAGLCLHRVCLFFHFAASFLNVVGKNETVCILIIIWNWEVALTACVLKMSSCTVHIWSFSIFNPKGRCGQFSCFPGFSLMAHISVLFIILPHKLICTSALMSLMNVHLCNLFSKYNFFPAYTFRLYF